MSEDEKTEITAAENKEECLEALCRLEKAHKNKKEYNKKYNLEHKEENKLRARKYRLEHKIEINNKSKIYHLEHKEQLALKKKEYQLKHKNEISKYKFENKEEIKKYKKEYYLKNKKKIIEQVINWNKNNQAKSRSYYNKKRFKRKDWTSIPFNAFFESAVGHHYDKFHIIWIPEWLHKKFYHNLEKRTNLDKMNAWAFAWYEGLVQFNYLNFAQTNG